MRHPDYHRVQIVVFRKIDGRPHFGARCLDIDISSFGNTPREAERRCVWQLIALANQGVQQGKQNPFLGFERAPVGFSKLLNCNECCLIPMDADYHQPKWAEVHQVRGATVDLGKGHVDIPSVWGVDLTTPLKSDRFDLITGRQINRVS